VLFFQTRRVHLAAATTTPNGRWVTQQARNVTLTGALSDVTFLIRDRDSKFVVAFDEVFRIDGVEVILTTFRWPQANAYAERFVRTARAECLDWLLILGPRQLARVLRVRRPLQHPAPTPSARTPSTGCDPAIGTATADGGDPATRPPRRPSTRLSHGRRVTEPRFGTLHARAYSPRLQGLSLTMRRRRLAQLTAVTDLTIWRLLCRELGLDQGQTEAAIRELVDTCLS
jgi:hypothetical protein